MQVDALLCRERERERVEKECLVFSFAAARPRRFHQDSACPGVPVVCFQVYVDAPEALLVVETYLERNGFVFWVIPRASASGC